MKNTIATAKRDDMPVDLDGCLVQVKASKDWFARRILPLSLDQLRWRPHVGRWSIAECLDHLNVYPRALPSKAR